MFPSDVTMKILSHLSIVDVASFVSSSKAFSLSEDDIKLLAYLKRLPRHSNLALKLLGEYEKYTPKKLLVRAVEVRDKVLAKYLLRNVIDDYRSVLKGYIKVGRYNQALRFAQKAKIHPSKYNYILYKQFSRVQKVPKKMHRLYFVETKKLINEFVKNDSHELLLMLKKHENHSFLVNILLYCCKYNKIELLDKFEIDIQSTYTTCNYRIKTKISRYLAQYDKLEYISGYFTHAAYCGYLLSGTIERANIFEFNEGEKIKALLKCNMVEQAIQLIGDNVKISYTNLLAKRASYEQISLLLPVCKRNVVESLFYYICRYDRFDLLELFTEYNIQLNINKLKTYSPQLLYSLLSLYPLCKDSLLVYAGRKCVIQGNISLLSKIVKEYDIVGIKEELIRLCDIHNRPYVKTYLENIN